MIDFNDEDVKVLDAGFKLSIDGKIRYCKEEIANKRNKAARRKSISKMLTYYEAARKAVEELS